MHSYRDNGKENGNYYSILGLYRDNGKDNLRARSIFLFVAFPPRHHVHKAPDQVLSELLLGDFQRYPLMRATTCASSVSCGSYGSSHENYTRIRIQFFSILRAASIVSQIMLRPSIAAALPNLDHQGIGVQHQAWKT